MTDSGLQPASSSDLSLQTQHSLLSRLREYGDEGGWRVFFDRYWRLIYGFARKAGLGDADAQDIVQDVMLSVSKSLPEYKKQKPGSFKGWLMTIVRRRMIDKWRKDGVKEQRTVPFEACEFENSKEAELEKLWQSEWEQRLLEEAALRVQTRVGARNFLIFDMLIRQQASLRDVCRTLGVNAAQVYLAKHRVGRLMKEEVEKLREGIIS